MNPNALIYFYLMIILFNLSIFILFEIDMPPRSRGGGISSAPRRRPTGSERRRRVQLREDEAAVDRDPIEHPQHDRDETEEVFEGVPVTPQNPGVPLITVNLRKPVCLIS